METNKQVIVGENNLPEVVQDKLGQIKALGKAVAFSTVELKEAQKALQKASEALSKLQPLRNI